MRLPTFKVDGRHAAIMYTDATGKRCRRTGRAAHILNDHFEGVLAGTVEPAAKMRLTVGRAVNPPGGPEYWHPVHVTADEAREHFRGVRLGGALRIRRCDRIRAARLARGLPVTGEPEAPETAAQDAQEATG